MPVVRQKLHLSSCPDFRDRLSIRKFGKRGSFWDLIALSANGNEITAESWDGELATFDIASGRQVGSFKVGANFALALSPDGKSAVTARYVEPDHVTLTFNKNGSRRARTVVAYKGVTDAQWFLNTLPLWIDDSGIIALAAPEQRNSSDVDTNVGCGTAGNTHLLYSPTGRAVLSRIFSDQIFSDKSRNYGKGLGLGVKVWDPSSGRLVRTFADDNAVDGMAISPDGKTLAIHVQSNPEYPAHGLTRFYNVDTGELMGSFPVNYNVSALAFTPDGQSVVTGGSELNLWDLHSGTARAFRGFTGSIRSVSFSRDGQLMITGSTDGTARIWNTRTGDLLATLVSFDDGAWVTITPEGFFDGSPEAIKRVSVVRGMDAFSLDQFDYKFYRPDLVQQKLAGDPGGEVARAAAELSLSKATISGAVPLVRIIDPVAGSAISSNHVDVTVEITDRGGGIGTVEWRVNQSLYGQDVAGEIKSAGLRQVTKVTKRLPLRAGENEIEVQVFNSSNLVKSDEFGRAKVTVTVPLSPPPPRLFAVTVGIDKYQSRIFPALHFATSDAQGVADALQKAGEKIYQQVDVTPVLDQQANAANLESIFTGLAGKIGPQDVFVLFLSGHGKTINGQFYFIPQDFSGDDTAIIKLGIGESTIEKWLTEVHAGRRVILVDACESGSLASALKSAFGSLWLKMNVAVLTASTDYEEATEGVDNHHGIFTYAFLSGIGAASPNDSIRMSELGSYVQRAVPKIIAEQHWPVEQDPLYFPGQTDFVLVSKTSGLLGPSAH